MLEAAYHTKVEPLLGPIVAGLQDGTISEMGTLGDRGGAGRCQ